MPCDYKKYPSNWKTEIRPAILKRANNCCELCKVKNGKWIMRGIKWGIPAYQYFDEDNGCYFYNAVTGESMGEDYLGDFDTSVTTDCKVVLTIAHLDHDIAHNHYSNLKAMCQRCHLNYDKDLHRETKHKNKEKTQPKLL